MQKIKLNKPFCAFIQKTKDHKNDRFLLHQSTRSSLKRSDEVMIHKLLNVFMQLKENDDRFSKRKFDDN